MFCHLKKKIFKDFFFFFFDNTKAQQNIIIWDYLLTVAVPQFNKTQSLCLRMIQNGDRKSFSLVERELKPVMEAADSVDISVS